MIQPPPRKNSSQFHCLGSTISSRRSPIRFAKQRAHDRSSEVARSGLEGSGGRLRRVRPSCITPTSSSIRAEARVSSTRAARPGKQRLASSARRRSINRPADSKRRPRRLSRHAALQPERSRRGHPSGRGLSEPESLAGGARAVSECRRRLPDAVAQWPRRSRAA